MAGVAGCALLLASCSREMPRKVEAAGEAIPKVTAVRAERQDLSKSFEISAEFRPYQEVEVHAKIAGYLKAIYVDVGDRVRVGQLLAVLEVPEFAEEMAHATASEKRSELDVVRARSEVDRAESALHIAKLSYDRLLAVSKSKPHLIAQQEIDNAAAKYREAEAQLATVRANVDTTQQQVRVSAASRARVGTMMSYLKITAPFSGVVTKRSADTGAMIQAGTASQTQAMPLVRISQVDRLRLTIPVPESVIPRVHIGSPVEIRVDSLQRVFQGKVSRFTGRLETSTRTMATEVDVNNADGSIMPGMFGYASLMLDKRADALAVPVQAISSHDTKPTVIVVRQDGRLEERPVTFGMETPNLVQITSGLRENELVAIGNRNSLKPGTRVEPKLIAASELAGGR
jgi:RND family efflux transporter MFP subunit